MNVIIIMAMANEIYNACNEIDKYLLHNKKI